MTIPLSGLRSFEVPLPTREEQEEIVRRIDSKFARLDGIVTEVKRASSFVDRLESSILSRAFRGELVTQGQELPR
jgi:type I restriction enzyme S subunit